MAVIELGEAAPPPADPHLPIDRVLVRRVALVVTTLLVLAGLNGSARPETHGLRPLWNAPLASDGNMWLTPDTAYFHTSDGVNSTIRAYDLAGGRLRWTSTTADSVAYFQPESAGGLLLLPADRATYEEELAYNGTSSTEYAQATVAIDAGTGRSVWRAVGDTQQVDGDLVLAGDHDRRGENLTALRLLRLADGSTIWNRATPGIRSWTIAHTAGRPDRLITGDGRGGIKVYSFADGRLLGAGQVPWQTGDPANGYYTDMNAIGDRLLITRNNPTSSRTSAYRLTDLGEIWHLDDTAGGIGDCGPVLCKLDGTTVSGRDPATGREVWRQPDLRNAFPVGPDRLLAQSSDDDSGDFQVIEARTGRLVGAPAHGEPASWLTVLGRSMLLMRPTFQPPNRTAVVNYDLVTGEQTLLGVVDPPDTFGCRSTSGYLACGHGGRIEVSAVATKDG